MKIYYKLNSYLKCKSKVLRNISLKNRLVLFIPLGMTICILMMGILVYDSAKSALKVKAETYSEQMLDIISENIYKNKQFYERAVSEFTMDETLIKGVIDYKLMSYQERAELAQYIDSFTLRKLSLLSDIIEVEVVSADYTVIYMKGFKYFKIDEIEKYAKEAKNGTVWFYSKLNGGENYVCLARPLKSMGKIEGYIFVAIKRESFTSPFYLLDMGENSDILLVNEDNDVIISKNNRFTKEDIESNYEFKKFMGDKKFKDSKSKLIINSEKYMVCYKKQKEFNWYIVMLTPYNYIHSEINDITIEFILIALTFIFLVGVISCLLYFSIKEPLYKLLNSMSKVSRGEFNIEIKDEYRDEISVLSNNFNDMVEKVLELIKKSQNNEIEKRDLEIRMLQAQINPHFLFNTLNSLKWTAIINQDYTVSEGLSALAELLRNTILDKNELISIKDEIRNIKNYIVIQKIRYGDSFNIEYYIDEELLDKQIIKFILQPIIENAIIHGFEENKSGQVINVSIQKENKDISITIRDNGKGFDVINKDKENKLSSIGLNNVDERIKLTFGSSFGCTIESILGQGTDVNIVIPNRD